MATVNSVNQGGIVQTPVSTEVKQPQAKSYLLNQEIKDSVSFGNSSKKEEKSGGSLMPLLGAVALAAATFCLGRYKFPKLGEVAKEAVKNGADVVENAAGTVTKEGEKVAKAVAPKRTYATVMNEYATASAETKIKKIALNNASPKDLKKAKAEYKEALLKETTLDDELTKLGNDIKAVKTTKVNDGNSSEAVSAKEKPFKKPGLEENVVKYADKNGVVQKIDIPRVD